MAPSNNALIEAEVTALPESAITAAKTGIKDSINVLQPLIAFTDEETLFHISPDITAHTASAAA